MNLAHREGLGDTGPPRLLFAGFELRLDSGELLRTGSLVRLQPQPAKILEILASRSGEVVSREEIRRLVWGDSYVDSDASLNFCIKEIRKALGDSATSPSFIETVPRRGYRFLKPVQVLPEPRETPAEPRPVVLPPATRKSRIATVGAILALLLLLTFLLGSRFGHHAGRQRLAVLPLTCHSQKAADRQTCSGITDALTVELSRQLSHEIDVIAPFTSQVFTRKDLPADVLLTGEATPTARGMRLDLALEQNGSGERLRSLKFDVELQEAPRTYGDIAREVARALQLSPPVSSPARPKPAAYEVYLRAVSLRHQMRFGPAAEAFEEATRLDPGFAPAWAELALCRVRTRDKVDDTQEAAQRAMALDPDLADSHVALAQVLFRHSLDWEGAGREYRRALALNPGSANAYSAYSFYLIALGRADEAIAAIRRARELNPASMELGSGLAWYLYIDRRYQDAIREIPGILDLYSLNAAVTTDGAKEAKVSALDTLLNSSLKTGNSATALKAVQGIEEVFGGPEIHSVTDFWPRREKRIDDYLRKAGIDTYARAKNALMLGDRGRALDLLTSDCSSASWVEPYAAVEPLFDALHSDPRWGQVLDCLKLPADAPVRTRWASRR